MRSHKRKYLVFSSIAVIFLVFGVATADWGDDDDDRRTIDCAAKLPPGGNTLGAPALWVTTGQGTSDRLYDAIQMGTSAPDSCITVINLKEILFGVLCDPNGPNMPTNHKIGEVNPGDTRTFCCPQSARWSLRCGGDTDQVSGCEACYRVDQANGAAR